MIFIVITPEHDFTDELNIVNQLFSLGLPRLHVRKPNYTEDEMRNYLSRIHSAYWNRVVLHDQHHLIQQYALKGIHFNSRNPYISGGQYPTDIQLSISCHSIKEIEQVPLHFGYTFLSPVFNSISKPSYQVNIDLDELSSFLHQTTGARTPTIALGGIQTNHIQLLKKIGFDGIAILGSLWNPNFTNETIINTYQEITKLISI